VKHGLVVGRFYPPHAGHHHLISTAAAACDRVTVVVAPHSGESIPLGLRLAWLRSVHEAEANVRFVGHYDDHPVDYADPRAWDAHCALFAAAVSEPVDAVFTSEEYGDELARRFGALHVAVDRDRSTVPVSGTAVRADPVANWAFLEPQVRRWFTRRVVVVGAESTGTTTLTRALAQQFALRGGVWADTAWVPEFGRTYTELKLAELRATHSDVQIDELLWTAADFDWIAAEQQAAEDLAAGTGSPVLFGDTNVMATRVWRERYLGPGSHSPLPAPRADLYLLTSDVGVAFTDDGLRDGEHLRNWMTARFRDELNAQPVPWQELVGPHSERLAAAVAATDNLLAAGWSLKPPP
jgi:NadR type nicotinamide-nucleotide adenylyltransferase